MNDTQQQQQINDFKMLKTPPVSGMPEQEPQLYKSELCRSWQETGICRYGNKCQFAHGFDELRLRCRDPKYKTKGCRSWQERGLCSYGQRCQFLHENSAGTRSPSIRSTASGSPNSFNSRFQNASYSNTSSFSPPTNSGQSYNHFPLTGSYSSDSKLMAFQQLNQGDIRFSSPSTQVPYSPYLSSGYDPKLPNNFNPHENIAAYSKPSPDTSYKNGSNYHFLATEENPLPPLPHYQLGPSAPPSLAATDVNTLSPTFGLRMRQAAMEYQALIEGVQLNEARLNDPSQTSDVGNLSLGLGHLQLGQRAISDSNAHQTQHNNIVYQQNRQVAPPGIHSGSITPKSHIYNNQNTFDIHSNHFDNSQFQNPASVNVELRSNPPGFSPQSANLANIAPHLRSNSHPSLEFPSNMRGNNSSEFQYLPSVSSHNSRANIPSSSNSYLPAGKVMYHSLENRHASSPPPASIYSRDIHSVPQNDQASNSAIENLETSPPSRVRLDVFKNINA